MRKVLGLLTEDFRLYHDLVAALKGRGIPFVSLSFSRRIPETVGAVLTSPAEVPRIRFAHVVGVQDVDNAIARALQLLKGKTEWQELLIGVDPGHEPGVAVLGDGDVLDTYLAPNPEAVGDRVRTALRTFPARQVRVRVGHGDPTNRNRILNSLAADGLRVEIVDEAATTPRPPQPALDAAVDIARTPGGAGAPARPVEWGADLIVMGLRYKKRMGGSWDAGRTVPYVMRNPNAPVWCLRVETEDLARTP